MTIRITFIQTTYINYKHSFIRFEASVGRAFQQTTTTSTKTAYLPLSCVHITDIFCWLSHSVVTHWHWVYYIQTIQNISQFGNKFHFLFQLFFWNIIFGGYYTLTIPTCMDNQIIHQIYETKKRRWMPRKYLYVSIIFRIFNPFSSCTRCFSTKTDTHQSDRAQDMLYNELCACYLFLNFLKTKTKKNLHSPQKQKQIFFSKN